MSQVNPKAYFALLIYSNFPTLAQLHMLRYFHLQLKFQQQLKLLDVLLLLNLLLPSLLF